MENKNPQSDQLLISYMTLRKTIGFLGIATPAILILGTLTIGGCDGIQYSISHYYYTCMGDVFVGMLCAISLFLITYKGHDNDHIATSLAGIFGFGVAFFPTSNNPDVHCGIRTLSDSVLRVNVHYISAALFFLTLAYISIFLFTKSKGGMTPQKKKRNKIYRTCGIIMIAAVIMAFLTGKGFIKLDSYNPVFWFEWTALFAFGVSWLIKGEFLLKD